jgi:hypothetical protein
VSAAGKYADVSARLLAARAGLSCDGDLDHALGVLRGLGDIGGLAPEHLDLLLRACSAARAFAAAEGAGVALPAESRHRQVAPDIDRALEALGYEPRYDDRLPRSGKPQPEEAHR